MNENDKQANCQYCGDKVFEAGFMCIPCANKLVNGDKQAEPVAFNGWYCAQCQRGVAPSEVTFHETHTECGRYITDDEPPAQPVQPAGAQGEPVAWILFRRDEDGLEPIMFYGGDEKPDGEFKDRFVLYPVHFEGTSLIVSPPSAAINEQMLEALKFAYVLLKDQCMDTALVKLKIETAIREAEELKAQQAADELSRLLNGQD